MSEEKKIWSAAQGPTGEVFAPALDLKAIREQAAGKARTRKTVTKKGLSVIGQDEAEAEIEERDDDE